MSATLTASDRLQELLGQAVRESALLESALDRETRALSNRDLEALHQAVAAKHQVARSLEQLTREQATLLRAGGFDPDGPGMDACLGAWDVEGLMRPLWLRLQDSMERCRRHNQINGAAVQARQHEIHQALQILCGEDTRTELYDPHGRTVASGPSRHISKA